MGNFRRAKISHIAAKGKFSNKIFADPRLEISIFLRTEMCSSSRMAQSELVYIFHCNIRGFHEYKEIWEASIGERLSCKKNFTDNFVDVMQSAKSAKILSHEKFPLHGVQKLLYPIFIIGMYVRRYNST